LQVNDFLMASISEPLATWFELSWQILRPSPGALSDISAAHEPYIVITNARRNGN
jgi:hypothetical protein